MSLNVNALKTKWFYKVTKDPNAHPLYDCLNHAAEMKHQLIVCRQTDKGRMYGSYLTPQQLLELSKDRLIENYHLYEVVRENQPVYLFFDLEWDLNQSPNYKQVLSHFLSLLNAAVRLALRRDFEPDEVFVCTATGSTGGMVKASFHVKIQTSSAVFENMRALKRFILWFHHWISNPPKDDPQFKDVLSFFDSMWWTKSNGQKQTIYDLQVYGRNQNFKMLGQSKYGSDRIQKVYAQQGSERITDHLVGVYAEAENMTFVETAQLGITIKDKVLKHSTGVGQGFAELQSLLILPSSPKPYDPDQFQDSNPLYYLDFIPNSGQAEQHWQVWISIGMALHQESNGTNQYLQDWIRWSEQASISKNQIFENCQRAWQSFQVKPNGYRLATIRKLARLCQPLLTTASNHKQQCLQQILSTQTDISTESYSERYVLPLTELFQRYDTIIERSPMGTGKTTAIFQYLKHVLSRNPKARVLFFSARTIFAMNITGELNDKVETGFICYKHVREGHSRIPRLVIQMESLYKLGLHFDPYDVVVMDESESCLKQFSSLETMRDHLHENVSVFEQILKSARKVILCDAFVSDRTYQLISQGLRDKAKTKLRINNYQPVAREAIELMNKQEFCDKILRSLKHKRKVFVIWGSKQAGLKFEQSVLANTSFQYKFYHADNDDDYAKDIGNVNVAWKDQDLIMTTPRITIGLNFDLPNVFDEICMYCTNLSCSPRDLFQTQMRIRHIKLNRLYYYFSIQPRNLIIDKKELVEHFTQRQNQMTQLELTLWNGQSLLKPSPQWLKNNHIHNVLEDNLTKSCYHELFFYYLKQAGYSLHKQRVSVDQALSPDHEASVIHRYNEIAEIDDAEALEIETRIKHYEATFNDKLRLGKHLFQRMLKKQLPEPLKEIIYNHCYADPYTREKFWNLIVEYKKELPDQYRIDAEGIRFPEMINSKAFKLQCIQTICLALGIPHSQDDKTVVSNEQFQKAIPVILQISDQIRSAFNLQDRGKVNANVQPIQQVMNIANQAFERWGHTSLEKKRKRIQLKKKIVEAPPNYQLIKSERIPKEIQLRDAFDIDQITHLPAENTLFEDEC